MVSATSPETALSDEQIAVLTTRGIELLHKFLDELVEDEDEERFGHIPNGVWLVLLPHGDPELFDANLEAGIDAIRRGKNTYFLHL